MLCCLHEGIVHCCRVLHNGIKRKCVGGSIKPTMALATQALVCPHLFSPTSCSTSASTSGRSTSSSSSAASSSSSTCSYPAAPGLLLNTQRPVRLGLGAFGRVTSAAEGEGKISRRWNGGVSAMADFQNSFTAKDLERDAAREALLLAVSNKGTVSFCLSF